MKHSLSSLRYRLLDGPASLEPLRVLESRAFCWNDRQVTCHVLGASHAVTLQNGAHTLTELLTCAPPEGVFHALAELPGDATMSHCVQTRDLLCRIDLTPFSLPPSHEILPSPVLGGGAGGGGYLTGSIEYAFPPQQNGVPITRIAWRATARVLIIETVHTYPEERRGVRSITRFEEAE